MPASLGTLALGASKSEVWVLREPSRETTRRDRQRETEREKEIDKDRDT